MSGSEDQDTSGERPIVLPIDARLRPYADVALTRLRYLHADWHFERSGETLRVTAAPTVLPEDVKREVSYSLYRERILAETMDLRLRLLTLVGGR